MQINGPSEPLFPHEVQTTIDEKLAKIRKIFWLFYFSHPVIWHDKSTNLMNRTNNYHLGKTTPHRILQSSHCAVEAGLFRAMKSAQALFIFHWRTRSFCISNVTGTRSQVSDRYLRLSYRFYARWFPGTNTQNSQIGSNVCWPKSSTRKRGVNGHVMAVSLKVLDWVQHDRRSIQGKKNICSRNFLLYRLCRKKRLI